MIIPLPFQEDLSFALLKLDAARKQQLSEHLPERLVVCPDIDDFAQPDNAAAVSKLYAGLFFEGIQCLLK